MSKDSVDIYWSPFFDPNGQDWSFLYPKPNTLFSTMVKDKAEVVGDNTKFLQCPAFSDKFKKTYVFTSAMGAEYKYDLDQNIIEPTSKNWISAEFRNSPTIKTGPIIKLHTTFLFFAEESMNAYFTPPFFQKPQYTQYGAVVPGQFNIGEWFRPYNFDIQMWSNSGELKIKQDEPIFYVEFQTEKKINLKQFVLTEQIYKYSTACVDTSRLFGIGMSLKERYNKFNNVGMREKILLEIKKNIID